MRHCEGDEKTSRHKSLDYEARFHDGVVRECEAKKGGAGSLARSHGDRMNELSLGWRPGDESRPTAAQHVDDRRAEATSSCIFMSRLLSIGGSAAFDSAAGRHHRGDAAKGNPQLKWMNWKPF